MFCYHVVCEDKHMDLVQANDETHAIAIVTAKFGKASIYRKNAVYKAIKA